jgi:hypothetical protein
MRGNKIPFEVLTISNCALVWGTGVPMPTCALSKKFDNRKQTEKEIRYLLITIVLVA